MFYFVAVFVLMFQMIREVLFSKSFSNKRNAVIAYTALIGMVLTPYFIHTLWIVVVIEIVILLLWVFAIKLFDAKEVDY